MKSLIEKDFNYLCEPPYYKKKEEPETETIGVYDLSRIVSKKTKFRMLDCKEVIEEFCNAMFVELAKRKNIDLNGITIKNKWAVNKEPIFVWTDEEKNEGYWTYGNWHPGIEMDTKHKKAYIGKKFKTSDSIMKEIGPYLPEDVKTYDDYIEYIDGIVNEEGKKHKELLLTEDNYIVGPRGGRKKFIPEFHPTLEQRRQYVLNRNRLYIEYNEKIKNGENITKVWIYNELRKLGFKTYDKYDNDGSDANDE